MNPLINPYLLYEPMEKESFRPIFQDLLDKGVKYIYEKAGISIGMFKLIGLTYRTDHIVYLGGLAINPTMGGKGEGYNMLQEILGYTKQQGYLRIELGVDTVNEKAIRLYEKCGFVKEGILKKYTHLKAENRFIDEFMMAYLF